MNAATNADQVVIVGGGPVGMMLALNLAALGVCSTLINRETGPRWHPKGSTQNARTMEHYRRLGIVDAVRAVGLPRDLQTDVTYFTTLDGWELARLTMPSEGEKLAARAAAPADDQEVEPLYRCNQMHAEAVLFDQVQACALVDKRYGHECTSWREDADGVTAEIENLANGRRETIRGRYIAGCDGARGIVRQQLGYAYRGETPTMQPYLGGPMVSTYIRAADIPKVARTRCWQYWVVNTHIRANIVAVDGKSEFLFTTKLDRPDQEPDEARIAKAFRDAVGHDIAVEFVGHGTWTAGQFFVAEKFGAGRAWLAGDAVHLFTPTGGFGMNTGVDDAANLGWKLAAMVQGWGGAQLLDSYEAERQPVAFRNTGASKALNSNVNATPVAPEIGQTSAAGDAARRVAGEYLSGGRPEFASLGVQLGARYDSSSITVSDGTPPPADDLFDYRPSGVPGGRAPHVWIGERHEAGDSLFDRFGTGFTVLRLGRKPAKADGLLAAFAKKNVPVKTIDVDGAVARDLYERDIVVVRPDQHIAWRGNADPADAEAVVAQMIGQQKSN
ncbi:FAD-dependent monooxygenase [Rhodoplanes sp. Z2-YC6860]|uniref:FAD-dependent monooxygenase n=1 Tax=Rhodoplanes sp. Z2-YC6860 TaxID=674703 RepID=UPI00078D04C5|nr:FAD-dependent monooxygenase [Rhodoplanes sp. Z2-YC6860]AMN44551.1 monooxygenase, FAD-binding [Rhodoplanes sp. Z2-YC6860]